MNGKFWITVALVGASVVTGGSTYFRVSQGVTLEQLDRNSRANRILIKQVMHEVNRVVGATAAPPGWRPDTTARLERIEQRMESLVAHLATCTERNTNEGEERSP